MYTSSGNVNQLLSAWRCTQRLALLLLLLVLRVFETSDCDFSLQCIFKWVLRNMYTRSTSYCPGAAQIDTAAAYKSF